MSQISAKVEMRLALRHFGEACRDRSRARRRLVLREQLVAKQPQA